MKSSQSIINSIEERDNSEIEWEDKMKRGEEMVNQVAYDQMFNNSLFFNYDYSTIREKKMKSLVNKKGNSHGKAAQMIQEHWLKKEETMTILPEVFKIIIFFSFLKQMQMNSIATGIYPSVKVKKTRAKKLRMKKLY